MATKTKRGGKQVRPGARRVALSFLRTGKVIAVALVILSAWIGYLALSSPLFTVQRVEARGNKALTQAEVEHFADVDGQPIWFVRSNEIKTRIADSPYVDSVKVRLQLPDAVVVTIRERQPDIRWLHDGQSYAVTSDGMIVDQVPPPAAPPTSPLSSTVPLSPSQNLSNTVTLTTPLTAAVPLSATAPLTPTANTRTFASVVTVVDTTPNRPLHVRDHVDPDAIELARRISLRRDDLGQPITRLEWDAGLGLSAIMGDGHQAVFGNSNDFERKFATLRFMLKDGAQFKFLDLRPTTPYYR